jgi:hypothetical protein
LETKFAVAHDGHESQFDSFELAKLLSETLRSQGVDTVLRALLPDGTDIRL